MPIPHERYTNPEKYNREFREFLLEAEDRLLEVSIEEAQRKGSDRAALRIAGRLKQHGFNNEFIAEVTGLSPEQLKNL